MERLPRSPPQVRIQLHDGGRRSAVRASSPDTANTTAARPRVTATNAARITCQAAKRSPSFTSKPISRKTIELRANATYSQNDSTATRVDGDMPVRAP